MLYHITLILVCYGVKHFFSTAVGKLKPFIAKGGGRGGGGGLIVLKTVRNICYSISHLSDGSLMDFHTSAATS